MSHAPVPPSRDDRFPLPWAALLTLAAAGFITILTEALPAGLLSQMGADLAVSEAMVGQLVTAYAIGSLLAAIPLTAATRGWPRRRLLLLTLCGFAVVNTVTALSSTYSLTLAARFFAGVFAGLLWALLAGYAARMVPTAQQGRAIAVAMVGTPLALSLGIPAGTFLGAALGWQLTFGLMSVATLALIAWARWQVPDFPGQAAGRQLPLRRVLVLPGIPAVLLVTLGFVLAHNLLYTYIVPLVAQAGMTARVDTVLLAFGFSALAGIWLIGVKIDRWLRALTLASTVLFALACVVLGSWNESPTAIYVGATMWGLAFGGAATLFQTASAQAAGDAADLAQSMIVTVWNLGIAGGGIAGGILLESVGVVSLPWAVLGLLVLTLAMAWQAQRHGFPRRGVSDTARAQAIG